MYDFILQLSIVVSLSAMIYLLARALPRVPEEDVFLAQTDHYYFDQLLAKFPITKLDSWITTFLAKFLRRLRVIVLKLDNLLYHYLVRVKQSNGEHKLNNNIFLDDVDNDENL